MANRVWFVYRMMKGRQVEKAAKDAMKILKGKEKILAATKTSK